jgi:hypothetical protein
VSVTCWTGSSAPRELRGDAAAILLGISDWLDRTQPYAGLLQDT